MYHRLPYSADKVELLYRLRNDVTYPNPHQLAHRVHVEPPRRDHNRNGFVLSDELREHIEFLPAACIDVNDENITLHRLQSEHVHLCTSHLQLNRGMVWRRPAKCIGQGRLGIEVSY